jgi:uncharacterized protein (TIGR02246 family)
MTKTAELREQIAAANKVFMEAFGRGDPAGLAALYTKDGQLLAPNFGPMTGRDAIRAFWQGAMDMGIKGAVLEIVEVEDHGETAIEVGKYTLLGEEGQALDEGKYIVIWKQVGGQWKLHRDIFNSSRPAPG